MLTGISRISAALLLLVLGICIQAGAESVEYELTIARQEVTISGKPAQAMTINGAIPGPVLRFTEGNLARIQVHNRMEADTSIHWHGLLVPPGMDGVPYISFPPIAPDATFTYEFPIRQSGTYWYHSHSALQEQSGVYGAIVIEPRGHAVHADRDHVVLLSDWTDEDPHSVLRTLKRGSEWYTIEKGSGQSILGAARLGMLGSYFQRELQRMPPMDISDVAYDRFLANGKAESNLAAGAGETVRLRIINGSATTYFHLEFAGGPMAIVAADGQDVEPFSTDRFLIGVAETYDVLVRLKEAGSFEFRATAHDGSGYASVWIGSGSPRPAPAIPRPNLYQGMGHFSLKDIFALTPAGVMGMADSDVRAGKFDRPGMMGMGETDMGAMEHMAHDAGSVPTKMAPMDHEPMNGTEMNHHSGMGMDNPQPPAPDMATEGQPARVQHQGLRAGKKYGNDFSLLGADTASAKNLAVDGMGPERPGTPYGDLKALKSTAFAAARPVREIRLTLDGDMERYVWTLNNKTLAESDSILVRQGEVTRFIMINRTMMHHPMHLHGHFFRVVNKQGDYAPLKHTVDVAPMATTVIEFDADEVGDWFFHCHLLYHMESGMARLVEYEDFVIDPALAAIRPNLYADHWYLWGEADILSNMTEGTITLANTRNILTAEWEAGWQEVDEIQWEGLVSYNRYANRFFSLLGGLDMEGEDGEIDETRGVFGIRYLLPLNLETRAWIDTDGGARAALEKNLDLTPRLALAAEIRYDTHEDWEAGIALTYLIRRNFSFIGKFRTEYGFGGGLQVRF
ncbi:MAG: multicopper oxidase domain-containing protein [Desulfobulbaceae bacterium]